MWFGYDSENAWFPVPTQRVKEVIELNKAGKKPASLLEDDIPGKDEFSALNSDLERMDKKFKQKTKKRKKRNNKRRKTRNQNSSTKSN